MEWNHLPAFATAHTSGQACLNLNSSQIQIAMNQTAVFLSNIKIACKWMFLPFTLENPFIRISDSPVCCDICSQPLSGTSSSSSKTCSQAVLVASAHLKSQVSIQHWHKKNSEHVRHVPSQSAGFKHLSSALFHSWEADFSMDFLRDLQGNLSARES